mgnify:CR=1 FL=1
MNDTFSVMLVDDHAVVRAGYRLLLSQTPQLEVTCEASTGEEACEKYLTHRPHVVVMDLNLPGIGGLAAIRRIRARDPAARILVFSIHDEPVYVARAREAGAMGYISKSCAPDRLVSAVVSIAHGQPFIEPAIAERLAQQSAPSTPILMERLTAREFDVLRLLARGHSSRDIAESLKLSVKTVANYVTSIKEKLQVTTTAELVRLAFQTGLCSD